MCGNAIETEQVEVFACGELNGVDIDGIWSTTKRNHLAMVMLVDVFVKTSDMEKAMKQGVEKVVNHVKSNVCEKSVLNGKF